MYFNEWVETAMGETRDYLLDTTMLGYVAAAKCGGGLDAQKVQQVANRLESIRREPRRRVFISAITVGESEYGLRTATKAAASQQAEARAVVSAFLPGLVLGVDADVAREYYADLRSRLFAKFAPKDARGLAKANFVGEWIDPCTQKVLGVQENDVWIASVAMAYNLTLISSDKMARIRQVAGSDLSYENWMA